MTLMKSGCHTRGLSAAGFEPGGRGQRDGIFSQHAGQAGEHVREVFLGIDAQAAAVFDDGIEDGALLSGLLITSRRWICYRLTALRLPNLFSRKSNSSSPR